MSKPTDDELKTALRSAIAMKEQGEDPQFIAKSLINLQYRMRFYEELLQVADRYLNHGQAEHERMKLLSCINKISEIEARTAKQDIEDFGLE